MSRSKRSSGKKHMVVFWTTFLLSQLQSTSAEKEVRERRDTYLDAYTETHGSSTPLQDFQNESPVYTSPSYKTHLPSSYGPPDLHIQQFYDAPSGPTGPTGHSGPSTYGAHLPPVYGAPYAAPDPGFKGLPLSLDLGIIFKIILKVLIFKMIVKFIAVICVLLFLPKFDSSGGSSGGSSDGGERTFHFSNKGTHNFPDDQLNRLTRMVLESVDKNSTLDIKNECADDTNCKLRRVTEYVNNHSTVPRLLNMFLLEFKARQEQKGKHNELH